MEQLKTDIKAFNSTKTEKFETVISRKKYNYTIGTYLYLMLFDENNQQIDIQLNKAVLLICLISLPIFIKSLNRF